MYIVLKAHHHSHSLIIPFAVLRLLRLAKGLLAPVAHADAALADGRADGVPPADGDVERVARGELHVQRTRHAP